MFRSGFRQLVSSPQMPQTTTLFSRLACVGVAASAFCSLSNSDAQNSGRKSPLTPKLKPKVLFVLGGPGAGKGTQCGKIVDKYGFLHLSAGDLLRAERNSGSKNGDMIDRMIREGQIVPVKVTLDLIRKAMEESGQELVLVDGFPRNFDNLTGWKSEMSDITDVQGVLFYDCPEDVMESRLMERGKSSGRADDNIEAIRKRFHTYLNSTMPVIDYYEKLDKVHRISATSSPEVVFKATSKVVEPIVKQHLVETTLRLLEAIAASDVETYKELCDPSLTAIEKEAAGNLVEGMKFHEFYFNNKLAGGIGQKHQVTISSPNVRLLDNVAIVSYVRLIQTLDGPTKSFEETRVWHCQNGVWKNVHFHRSEAN